MIFLYDVFDTKKNEMIAEKITRGKIVEMLHEEGLPDVVGDKISRYCDSNFMLRKRYTLTKHEYEGDSSHRTVDLKKKYEEIYQAAEALRNGGKIVTTMKNGKLIRYVLPKGGVAKCQSL